MVDGCNMAGSTGIAGNNMVGGFGSGVIYSPVRREDCAHAQNTTNQLTNANRFYQLPLVHQPRTYGLSS